MDICFIFLGVIQNKRWGISWVISILFIICGNSTYVYLILVNLRCSFFSLLCNLMFFFFIAVGVLFKKIIMIYILFHAALLSTGNASFICAFIHHMFASPFCIVRNIIMCVSNFCVLMLFPYISLQTVKQ